MKFNSPKVAGGALTEKRMAGSRPAQRGMALVITLIMLSVTLVMAIAFLAVANRERATVTTSTDAANAHNAADSALAAAQAQILANVLGSGNGIYNFQELISTNYINDYGFISGLGNNPTNINFDYRPGGFALQAGDFEQGVANLQYLPRAPVMVSAAEPAGRFYLDLNRNGAFEATSGNTNNQLNPALYYVDPNGITNSSIPNVQTGDPQWIGVLERPDSLHSPDNKFIARYAFFAVPIGNGLDINYVYNQVLNQNLNLAQDGFFRNQGVGSWEINLAAFLTDLNTNQWDPAIDSYNYLQPGSANRGAGFEDALALLSWRYNGIYGSLASASSMIANPNVLRFDNIDEYSDGALQITTTNVNESFSPDPIGQPWAGADNTNRFFNLPTELFDATKSSPNFVARLTAAGTNLVNGAHPTYDRYTFYRMLDELGTDSSADDAGKIDLNFSNALVQFSFNSVLTNYAVVTGAQTNLVAWTPLQFFTIAADRMLRTYTTNWFQSNPSNYLATYYGMIYSLPIDPITGYGFTNSVLGTNTVPAFGITNIPALIGNQVVYSPAVNRILQLAANIYDASTNSFYPSVFRPVFNADLAGNIFIQGYDQVTSVVLPSDQNLGRPLQPPVNLKALFSLGAFPTDRNVYGIPWIIGAKKNLPNFNQFYMQNTVRLTRKLQVTRTKIEGWNSGSGTSKDYTTNQMFIMGITNHVGFSLWNSYTTNYPGSSPTIVVNDFMNTVLSNALIQIGASNFPSFTTNLSTWPGSSWDVTMDPNSRQAAPNSFIYGGWDFTFLPASVYQSETGTFVPLDRIPRPSYDTNILNTPNLPQMTLMTTNWLQAYILDNGHVVDYVQFGGPASARSVNNELLDVPVTPPPYQMWITNGSGTTRNGPNQGVVNQIYVSRYHTGLPADNSWKSAANLPPGLADTPEMEAGFFDAFFTGAQITYLGQTYDNTNLQQQAPYTPTRVMTELTLWQANDPLVHYLASDLTESNSYTGIHRTDDPLNVNNPIPTIVQNGLGQSGSMIGDDRYQPWGKNSQFKTLPNVDQNAYNLAYRDPLVYGSDNWDFPTNRYPTVGWLGRVHRGTPWQTVYLKATNILQSALPTIPSSGLVTWMDWSGNQNSFDANNAAPVQDDVLFDIFTTALDDNASRGTLSVNQTHLAAWSALLSGLNVISNATETPNFISAPVQTNVVINPAGLDTTTSALWQMVENPTNGINAVRANVYGGAFSRAGDIVRVPALTEQSPFLNRNQANRLSFDVSDEMYERIPQQILGLVRVGSPRYVIYCYGQALRPAQDGTALDLNHNGLVTNYQVVAESASRAVISVHPHVTLTTSSATGNLIPVTNYTATVESYNPLPPN